MDLFISPPPNRVNLVVVEFSVEHNIDVYCDSIIGNLGDLDRARLVLTDRSRKESRLARLTMME